MRLSELAQLAGGRLQGADAEIVGASNDTRRMAPGQMFVALGGTKADGHDYVAAAVAQGASAALVARPVDSGIPQIIVPEVLTALQRGARGWRRRFTGPVCAITGSNGKTTTKEMLASCLRAHYGPRVLATQGNLNNHLGVPLTLLGLQQSGAQAHRAAVIEMGANHPGEIAELAAIAEPQVGVITLAGAAHLEGFGSIEGVARSKGELFAALSKDGCAAINADDQYASLWQAMAAHCRQLSFGLGVTADIRAEALQAASDHSRCRLVTPLGHADLRLPLPGRHNVMNALAAATSALAAGIPLDAIVSGLESVQRVGGRLVAQPGKGGAQIVDDTYNANPTSLRAALDWLATVPGRRWLVLGDMAELGSDAERWHREVGEWARAAQVERLYGLGGYSRAAVGAFGSGATHFDSAETLVSALVPGLAAGITVLIKGSRSMRMERVVQAAVVAAGENSDAH